MNKRFEKAKLRFEAEVKEKGGILLDVYQGPLVKIRHRCAKGHVTEVTPAGLRASKHGCSICADIHRAKKDLTSLEDIKEIAESKGLELLTLARESENDPLFFVCSEGHETSYTFKVLKSLTKCKQCSRSCKRTLDEAKKVFEDHGYKLLATKYINGKTKMPALCPKGHKVQASYTQMQQNGSCCKQCSIERHTGKNSPRWRHDLNETAREENYRQKRSTKANRWSKAIKRRDKKCVVCGSTKKLHSHHLNAWATFPDQRFNISNGVTLCKCCHEAFHSYYGKGENTKEQYEEWVGRQEIKNA